MREISAIRLSEPRAVKIVVAYDLREAAVRAERLCELVDEENSTPLDRKLWRFTDIAAPATSGNATADAEGARVLLVAWAQPEGVPSPIVGWLQNWARGRAVTNAILVALPAETPAEAEYDSPTLALLQRVAFEHNLHFLGGASPDLGSALDDFSDELRLREQTLTPTLAHILDDMHYAPHEQWGIND